MLNGKLALYCLIYFFASSICAQDQTMHSIQYKAISSFLTQYERPFTVLELWSGEGDLSFEIAKNFKQSVCFMTEFEQAQPLLMRAKKQKLNNIALLNYDLSIQDLIFFGECEHVDVVLVPDISTKPQYDFKKTIDAVLTLGDYIFIESSDNPSFVKYLHEKGGKQLEISNKNHSLFLFSKHKKYLLKRRWNHKKIANHGEYYIESTFKEKKLIKKKQFYRMSISTWHPGINLLTFKKLNGTYPVKETIISLLDKFSSIKHNDLHIFNIVIQGSNLVPIDVNESGKHFSVKYELQKILNQFKKNITAATLYELDEGILEALDEIAYAQEK